MVSQAQNAFIKRRCIHDNFLYVQRVIQLLHKKKQPALFIKLDISKAFDCVGWQYLLEVLAALGFSTKWRNQISSILGSSSSRILMNGRPSQNIKHAKGLMQGDPLLPLLFIIAIDPLQKKNNWPSSPVGVSETSITTASEGKAKVLPICRRCCPFCSPIASRDFQTAENLDTIRWVFKTEGEYVQDWDVPNKATN